MRHFLHKIFEYQWTDKIFLIFFFKERRILNWILWKERKTMNISRLFYMNKIYCIVEKKKEWKTAFYGHVNLFFEPSLSCIFNLIMKCFWFRLLLTSLKRNILNNYLKKKSDSGFLFLYNISFNKFPFNKFSTIVYYLHFLSDKTIPYSLKNILCFFQRLPAA